MVEVTRKELLLYSSFLLTTLGDRMWMFSIGLFMHRLGGMAYVATQQLGDSFLKLMCISWIGPSLDKVNRARIIQRSLLVNNVAVAVSALTFAYMFAFENDYQTLLMVTAVIVASISRVASEIQRVCFTKDWVVVISEAENIPLERVNKRTLLMDHLSSVVLPLLTGVLLDYMEWTYVCIFIVVYNLASWVMESSILRKLYNETDELKSRRYELEEENELRGLSDWDLKGCSVYASQSSFLAGFGLTLLFMTVLGFDNLAASYGQRHGMSTTMIGAFRCLGSAMGIVGVTLYEPSMKSIGLLWTVTAGLAWQNVFIYLCGISVLLPGSTMDVQGFIQNTTTSDWINAVVHRFSNPEINDVPSLPYNEVPVPVYLFFVGISMARFGLWLADPSINQIQQETVPEHQRYTVFLTQTALCELFSVLKDIIVILLPFTSLFGALTLGSCFFVFSGFLLNLIYHAKCGFSCSNIKMHLPMSEQNELELSEPERQSLMEGSLPDKEPVIEETVRLEE